MALADTTTRPNFITLQPDYQKRLSVVIKWETGITTSRNGGEQRSCGRAKPLYSFTYQRSAIKPTNFALLHGRAMQDTGTAVVVPNWTKYYAASSFATHTVTLGATITTMRFKVGSWIYVSQSGSACFRKITAIAGAVITLSSDSGDIEPAGFTWATFSAGARVYPCLLGVRIGNGFGFEVNRVDRSDMAVSVEEL